MKTFTLGSLDLLRTVAIGGAVLLHLGCAGDDASAGAAVDSGLAPDRSLVSLTDAEALQLCTATADAAKEIFPLELRMESTCTLAAVTLSLVRRADGTFGIDRMACERARDQCLEHAEWSGTDEPPMCELHPMRSTTGAACTASVADYERCASAVLHTSAALVATLNCASLAAQSATALPSMSSPTADIDIPECESFEAKCGGRPALPSR